MPRRIPPKADHIFRKRRTRTLFTKKQQTTLEAAFLDNHWPPSSKKEKLATELDMTLQSVRTWFQNRRAKSKREEEWKKMKTLKKQTEVKDEKKTTDITEPVTADVNDTDKCDKDRSLLTGHYLRSSPAISAKMSAMFNTKVFKKKVTAPEYRNNESQRMEGTCSDTDASECTSVDGRVEVNEEDADSEDKDRKEASSDSSDQSDKDEGNQFEDKSKKKWEASQYSKVSGVIAPCLTESELVVANHAPTVSSDIFTSIIDLMTVVEGGITKPTDPSFNSAANHALYGIRLKDGDTLFCDKKCGFYIKNDEKK